MNVNRHYAQLTQWALRQNWLILGSDAGSSIWLTPAGRVIRIRFNETTRIISSVEEVTDGEIPAKPRKRGKHSPTS